MKTLEDLEREMFRKDPVRYCYWTLFHNLRWYWPANFLFWLEKRIRVLREWFENYGDDGSEWDDDD